MFDQHVHLRDISVFERDISVFLERDTSVFLECDISVFLERVL